MLIAKHALSLPVLALAPLVIESRVAGQAQIYEFQPPAPRNDQSYGSALAAVGDLDQDGISDFAVGSPGDSWSANLGRIYVHSGRTGVVVREILGTPPDGIGTHLQAAGDWNLDGYADIFSNLGLDKAVLFSGRDGSVLATFTPPITQSAQRWVMGGDFDRDGKRDLLVGQPNHIASGTIRCGHVVAVSGRTGAPLWEFLSNPTVAAAVGSVVCLVGDIDGDSVPDVTTSSDATYQGLSGSVFVVSGRTGAAIRQIAGWSFQSTGFGGAMADPGDMDRDGRGDIAITSHRYTSGTKTNAGRVTIFSGATGLVIPGLDWTGATSFQQLGASVASIGDFNNDGSDDIAAGSFYIPASGTPYYGKVQVYSGSDGALLFEAIGSSSSTQPAILGRSVARAGDLNHDGSADLIFGVYNKFSMTVYSKVRACAGIPNSGIGNPVYRAPILYSLQGSASNDQYGMAVHGGGDIDGDGHPDFVIGANATDVGSLVNAGEARAYSGRGGALLYTFRGAHVWNYLGDAAKIVRDVNHDGRSDILVGGHGYVNGTLLDAGRATLYSGLDGSVLKDFTGTNALQGLGQQVASAGDVDNDGDGDSLIAAPGENRVGARSGCVYLFGGAARSYALIQRFDGDSPGDEFGAAADGIGDVNGDGHDDFAIGSPFDDNGGSVDCGSVKVFSGKDGALLRTTFGFGAADHFGAALSRIGDIDGDGTSDYAVGAPNAAPKLARSGRSYVFSGRTGAILLMFDGDLIGDKLGAAIAAAGDVNKDGTPDILIGAPGAGTLGTAGRALVFSGRSGRLLYWFEGAASDDGGLSVAGSGDITGDGFADLVIGAPQLSSQAGSGFVVVVSGSDAASFTFGSGCPGTGGKVPSITGVGLPRIGATNHRIDLSNALGSAPAVLAVGVDVARIPLGGTCVLVPGSPATVPFTTSGVGSIALPLPIPNLPSLVGANLYNQFVVLDTAGAGLGALAVSPGLHILIGKP